MIPYVEIPRRKLLGMTKAFFGLFTKASKLNPIEHRMFSYISNNWSAQPLSSYETVLKFIRTTTTSAGLKIRAVLSRKNYQKGVKVPDAQMEEIELKRYTLRPNWNYSISPSRM